MCRAGRHDMNQLKEAMLLLVANDIPLGPEWQDHPLGGDWEGHRECHIGGDFPLAGFDGPATLTAWASILPSP